MDCVGCDKCRLWGKIQTTGVATALKVLFELDEKALRSVSPALLFPFLILILKLNCSPGSNLLQRSEIVALMNTLYRFSESLHAVDKFRDMWRKLEPRESTKIAEKVEESTAAKARPSPAVHEEPPLPSVFERLMSLFNVCKNSTVDCIRALFWRAANTLVMFFKPSGKENGPGYKNEL